MDGWERFREYPGSSEAQAEAEFLEQNAVPAKVEIDEPVPGLVKAAYVLVPSKLLHRAQWIMAQQQSWTEQELTNLATGELGKEGGNSADDDS